MSAAGEHYIVINGRFLSQPISGVQRYACELLLALDELLEAGHPLLRGMRFELIAPRRLRRRLPLRHIPLRCAGRFSGHLWEQLELPALAGSRLLFCPGNTAPALSLLQGKPLVVTVHDLSYRYFPQAYSRAFRAVYHLLIPLIMRRARRIITVSRSEEEAIRRYYPAVAGRLTAIQNGGLPYRYLENLPAASAPDSAGRLLYVGALNPRKNVQGIIRALQLLPEHTPWQLTVVGGAARSFHELKLEIPPQMQERVEWLGQVDDTERLIGLYRSSAALVFPSFYESSGLPPVEAMACGCPVITADIPSLRERCGDAALYCDPHNPADIAARITQLLDDEKMRRNLQESGKRRAAQFTWQQCALQTVEVLQSALPDRHRI